MDLLDLAVKIVVDDQASDKVEGIGSKISSGLGTAAKAGAAAMAATTAAVTGATAAFANQVGSVAEYGDNIDKMSQKMGLTAEAYQEWDAVMQHSGTSMEAMKASMKTLANAAEGGNEAFQRLGLSQEQVASMSQQDLFEATIAGLQNVEDTTERTYLAGQLLGRGATELGALLNTSAEDTQAMRDRVHELGGVMSDESVKAAARFQDSLQDMRTAMDGLQRGLTSEFLPGFATVMDGLGMIFSGDSGGGAEVVRQGVEQIMEAVREVGPKLGEIVNELLPVLLEALGGVVAMIAEQIPGLIAGLIPVMIDLAPTLMEAALQMFLGLVQALAESGPQLIDSLVEVIMQLANLLIEYGPQFLAAMGLLLVNLVTAIIQKAPEIIAGLVELIGNLLSSIAENGPGFLASAAEMFGQILIALGQAVPQILSTLGEALLNAVGAVTGMVGDMLNAGGEFLGGLIEGIGGKLGEIAESVGRGIADAIDSVGNFVSDMLQAGADLVQGLIDGIWNNISGIGEALMGGLNDAVANAKAFLGIASPSKLFRSFGEYTMEGFALGINDMTDRAVRAMEQASEQVYSAASGEIAVGSMFGTGEKYATVQRSRYGVGDSIVINLNYTAGDDATQMVRDIARGIRQYRMAGAL